MHSEVAVQSEPEPEPIPLPKVVKAEMSLQTEPEPMVVVSKLEMGIEHHSPEPSPPLFPVLVDNGVRTDPLPEPTALSAIGRGLPPLVIVEAGRGSTFNHHPS